MENFESVTVNIKVELPIVDSTMAKAFIYWIKPYTLELASISIDFLMDTYCEIHNCIW